jgi:hypothetical protein
MMLRDACVIASLAAGLLSSASLVAAPADCERYLARAMQLNQEVQRVITSAIEQRLDVDAATCRFRTEEWSVRADKHQAWCSDKEPAAIDQRLAKMSGDLAACSAALDSPSGTTVSQRRLTFDELPLGALAADAFASAGARLIQGDGTPGVYAPEPNMVLPAGHSNVLLVAGNRTTSLTIAFDAPVGRVALTRIGTANGASTPTWKLEAFDGAGHVVGSVGEEHGLPSAPQAFSIDRGGIVRVVLSTDNRWGEGTWATWNSLPVAAFEFEY